MRAIYCPDCQQSLRVEHFYPSEIRSATVQHRCKACTKTNPRRQAALKHWRDTHRDYLKACLYQWRRDNPEKWRVIAQRSRIKNMDKVLIRNRERELLEATSIPPWVNRKKIRAIYEEARQLTRTTGIRHEVDHIYPLRGRNSCGLHVEWNLRIITGSENRKKFNKMPEELAC